MGIFVDTLTDIIDNSVADSDATREDWEQAVRYAFGPKPEIEFEHPVIGLTGLARSGKDTVGAMLVARHGFTRVSFADGVREAALALDPLIKIPSGDTVRLSHVVDFYGWDEAKAIPEVRRTLQRIGSEAGWMIHGQNLWIDLAVTKITGPTVITDVRFAHEVAWLDSVGGSLWRIERPGNEQALTGATAAHASEAGDLGREPDAVIVNDGTLDELTATVNALIKNGGVR